MLCFSCENLSHLVKTTVLSVCVCVCLCVCVCVFVCVRVFVCVCACHRLLEGDLRSHTKILGRNESNASMHSAKSASSQRGSVIEVEGHQDSTHTTEPRTTLKCCPTSKEQEMTTPPSSPETPVKSKPAAPYFSEVTSESSREGSSEGEEDKEGVGGIGPEASIILDDGLDTRIDLDVVLPGGVGVDIGSGLEEEVEIEVTNEPSTGGKLQPLQSRTTTFSPAKRAHGKDIESSSGSDADGSKDGEEVGRQEEEPEVDVERQEMEERDVLPELKLGKGRGSGPGATVKRIRSETETGRKVSLASLVGRVRSQTIQDGGLKDKHSSNKVGSQLMNSYLHIAVHCLCMAFLKIQHRDLLLRRESLSKQRKWRLTIATHTTLL